MLTYALTTRTDSGSDPVTRDVDCHYFNSDIQFTYFKDGANKTVLAVPTDHVVSVELKQQHDGFGEAGPRVSDSKLVQSV